MERARSADPAPFALGEVGTFDHRSGLHDLDRLGDHLSHMLAAACGKLAPPLD
ncbi:MAG TPA: hypothetical protein VMJ31_03890 [Methylocystis sp.]|nr:hypothetical protein [Methylocystis sp.]